MSRRNRTHLQKIEGIHDLEGILSNGGPGFTVQAVCDVVENTEWVANGRNGAIHNSKLVFFEHEKMYKKREIAYLDLDKPLNGDKNTLYIGFVVFPEKPFFVESTSRNRYAIGGGLSQNKELLDALLEKEGFYEHSARVLWNGLTSKVMDDRGLKGNRGLKAATNIVKQAFYKQYTPVPTQERKKGCNGITNKIANMLNEGKIPLNGYLQYLRTYISQAITYDHKYVDTHIKPNIVRLGLLPLGTYKNKIEQQLAMRLGPPQYLTSKK